MRKWPLLLTLCLAAALLLSRPALAAEEERRLVVTSEQQSIDYAARVLTYEGNVTAHWQDYDMEADQVKVYITEEGTLGHLEAFGSVEFSQGQALHASCDSVSYQPAEDLIVMQGNVSYQDDIGNRLTASKVSLWPEAQRVVAEGTPVQAVYILGEELRGPAGQATQ